ncbi:MAG: VOC family protein [Nitrospinaceae bacterium]
MSPHSALGIKRIFSYEFVVDFFDRTREFYVEKMGFAESHRSTPDWERKFKSKGIYFSANEVKVLVTSPLSSHSYTAQYLKLLCPGIRRVTFQVDHLETALTYLKDHHATFIHKEKEIREGHTVHRFITIATPIGFLEFTFLEIDGDENEIPMFETAGTGAGAFPPFQQIDHMTINARTMYPICNFLEHVMGFEEFWKVAFHTPDYKSGKKGTGLSSRVMWDPASRIKFATNEPLYPHFNQSQIQTFIDRNHGAGIQHVAFRVEDLIDTVRTLRHQGIGFLDTPDAYYDLLPGRMKKANIGPLREDRDDLKRERILVDGKDGNYLLQIFLKDASLLYHEDNAGPFFYEIIQRRGHEGFGEGNFRALFEAIEFQEAQP